MEPNTFQQPSKLSIGTMLKSIEDCMVRLQDEVSDMVEMLEALSPGLTEDTISEEMT